MKILDFITKISKTILSTDYKSSLEEIYLSQATSLEDVERRQQAIARGQAPWQIAMRGPY